MGLGAAICNEWNLEAGAAGGWDKARIADFAVHQRDVTAESAHLNAEVEIDAAVNGPAQINLSYTDEKQTVNFVRKVDLHTGTNVIDFPIEIVKPNLWFPAGYGGQPLYSFTAQIDGKGTIVEERKLKTGLRSIVLDRHLDQWGRSFQLIVNGIPVFAKGADVIPFDSFRIA